MSPWRFAAVLCALRPIAATAWFFGLGRTGLSPTTEVQNHAPRGMEIAKQRRIEQNANAAAEIDAALKAGPRRQGKCSRFVVLATQRSGGSWLMDKLRRAAPEKIRSTNDAFNWRDRRTGSQYLRIANFVSDYQADHERRDAMSRLGPKIWAETVWNVVEQGNFTPHSLPELGQPCAVGFKMLGPEVDLFTMNETKEILKDNTVKKIILERGSAYHQYLSRQWTCWLGKSHIEKDDGLDWLAWTENRTKRGEFCECGHSSHLASFLYFNNKTYSSWRSMLAASGQDWAEIRTEELPEELDGSAMLRWLSDFLLKPGPATRAAKISGKRPGKLVLRESSKNESRW